MLGKRLKCSQKKTKRFEKQHNSLVSNQLFKIFWGELKSIEYSKVCQDLDENKKTTPRIDRKILTLVENSVRPNATDIAKKIRELKLVNISPRTVRNRLHEYDLHGRALGKKPLLNKQHIANLLLTKQHIADLNPIENLWKVVKEEIDKLLLMKKDDIPGSTQKMLEF